MYVKNRIYKNIFQLPQFGLNLLGVGTFSHVSYVLDRFGNMVVKNRVKINACGLLVMSAAALVAQAWLFSAATKKDHCYDSYAACYYGEPPVVHLSIARGKSCLERCNATHKCVKIMDTSCFDCIQDSDDCFYCYCD